MHLLKTSSTYPRWQQTIPRILSIIGFVCFSLFSLALSAKTSYAAGGVPGGDVSDPVVRQIDIAQPAVVRMITKLGGSLSVRFTTTSPSVSFPQGGGTYPIELSGTGAFISAHGDILTADHVVNPPHDQQLDNALYQTAANDIANYINTHFQVTQPYTADQVVASLEAGVFPSTTTYGTPSSQAYLSTAYAGKLSGTKIEDLPSSVRVPVDRIEQQSSFNVKDVAIVHVKGMDDMPSIRLDDSDSVQEQDTLTIIGFPGNGDISDNPINLLTSSVNKIYVSALKTTDAGAPVIQVGGNVEHGDSGGPALDANGNIVGVVSFGSADTGSTSFLQASNSAEDLIQQLGLDTRPGSLQTAWSQAIKDYSSLAPGHWHKAEQELQALSTRYQQFAGINPYLSYAQSQATHEQVPQPQTQPNNTPILLPIGVGLVILIIAAILLVMMLRRGQSRRVSLAGVPITTGAPGMTPVFSAPSTPSAVQPFPGQNGNAEQDASAASPLYAPQHYINNTPDTFGNPSPAYIPSPASLPVEETVKASDIFLQKPAERVMDTPSQFSSYTSIQADGQPESDKTVSGPARTPSWTYSVPRRPDPSSATPEMHYDNAYGQSLRIAPCGHLNTQDVRFCRVCGKPVATNETPWGTDNT